MGSVFQQLADHAHASLNYRCSKAASDYWRIRFSRAKAKDYLDQVFGPPLEEIAISSLCGEKQVPEQILSLLSFLQHVGVPEKWTIVSDGSLSPQNRERLKALHPVIQIDEWHHYLNDQNRVCVETYSQVSPMGKKLALVTSLSVEPPSLYIDTDVIFFPGAFRLRNLLRNISRNYFLRDNQGSFIPALLTDPERGMIPVNGGFLIQAKPIAWTEPLARLQKLFACQPEILADPRAIHLLEQTVLYLAYNACGAQPLDEHYVLQLDDAYDWRDRHVGPETVLRHYVVQTRMKFWRNARHYLK